jgi:zinc protease
MIDRSIKPKPKEGINFHLPGIVKFGSNNGLKILYVKKKTLPIVQLNLVIEAGSKFDPENKKGISNLLAAMIDEGAGEYDAFQLSNEIEMLGSLLQISSDQDCLYVSLLSIEENFKRSFELFSKILTSPRFDENDFLREKRRALVKILQSRDEPSYVASTVFEKTVFGESHPYSFPEIGLKDTVEKIDNIDLKSFYKNHIIPNNSTMVVVGSVDKERIEDLEEQYLDNWKFKTHSLKKLPLPVKAQRKIYLINKDDAAQSEIRIGHLSSPRNSKDYFAKYVMNMILGGQFTSRINLSLREQKGYTYGAHSSFNYIKEAAYFSVSTSVNSGDTLNAIKEIIKELEAIRQQITDEELYLAKSSIIRKYPSIFETYGYVARNLITKVIHDLPDDYFNTYIQNIQKVSLEDALTAAQNNIYTDALIIVVVGNANILRSQLAQISSYELAELDTDGNEVNQT